MKNLVQILIALFFAGVLSAQQSSTAQQTVQKMKTVYENANSYSMQIVLQMFTKDADAKPVISGNGKVMFSGVNYFSSMMGKTVLMNSDYRVVTDEKEKLMIVADALPKDKKKSGSTDLLDTSLYNAVTMTYLENTATSIRIEIKPNDAEDDYRAVRIRINPGDYSLTEVEYLYRVNPDAGIQYERALIRYTSVQINCKLSDSLFSHSTYFIKKGNVLSPVGSYRYFHLVDQRNQNLPTLNQN